MLKKHQSLGVGMTSSKTELGRSLKIHRIELKGVVPLKPIAEPKTELGEFIRSRRKQLGLTLTIFAKKLRLSTKKAEYLEIGERKTIDYTLFMPLIKALKLDTATLSRFVYKTAKTKPDANDLGQLVRLRRMELGLSMAILSQKLKVSKDFVRQIEYGHTNLSASDNMIKQLARMLKLDVARLQAVRPKRKIRRRLVDITTLDGFLTSKRLELQLPQREIAKQVGKRTTVISQIEKGKLKPNPELLNELSSVLKCEIPANLLPGLILKKIHLSGQGFDDLRKIKDLSDFADDSTIIEAALEILRQLLQKQPKG